MISMILTILGSGFLGAILNRIRGGLTNLPKAVKLILITAPMFFAAGYIIGIDADLLINIGIGITMFASIMGAWALGHGAYFDMGTTQPEKEKDRIGDYQEELPLGYVLRFFIPRGTIFGSREIYELFALSISGLLITLIPGILIAVFNSWVLGVLFAASGMWKGISYYIWHQFDKYRGLDTATEFGEYTFGFLLYVSITAIVVFSVGVPF
jgi:hypothetical protein